jgi:hypothetical protein
MLSSRAETSQEELCAHGLRAVILSICGVGNRFHLFSLLVARQHTTRNPISVIKRITCAQEVSKINRVLLQRLSIVADTSTISKRNFWEQKGQSTEG